MVLRRFRCVACVEHEDFVIKVPLRRKKIVDPILNATEQHFPMSLNGVFSFLLSGFVFEISGFS